MTSHTYIIKLVMLMNIFENIILSGIILLFPVLCYLFYIVANKNIDEKRQKIILIFILYTIIYLIYKYYSNTLYSFLLFTIPLYIIYKKNYRIIFIITNIILLILSYLYNPIYSLIFFIESIFIYLVIKDKLFFKYLVLICIINTFYIFMFDINNIYNNFLYLIIYVLYFFIVYYTITSGENVINYHIEYKKLKKENEIRKSLFKITHEIKNPLAVCKAYVDMFNYDDKECAKKYIPIISGEIDKMLILLQDFLLVNKDNIKVDIMDVNMMLEDSTKGILGIQNLKYNIDCSEDEIFINGDYNRLSQVVTNLIKNGYEANATEVYIKSYIKGSNAIIDIIDNGDGISNDNMKKMYEPFYTTKRDGTGLGVPLSKEIIEAHNGTLNYYKNDDKGTIARIILPIQNN